MGSKRVSEIRRKVRWLMLPYGRWKTDDGREVLFNRCYKPILQRTPDGKISIPDTEEWVSFHDEEWFYCGHNLNKESAAARAYTDFVGHAFDWEAGKAKMRDEMKKAKRSGQRLKACPPPLPPMA